MLLNVNECRVSRPAFAVVHAVLEEVRKANRYQDRSIMTEDGRHIAKGGFWNDRDGRAAYGIAQSDADLLRRELRAIGAKVTRAEADALLMQAEMGELMPADDTTDSERKRAARAAARANGLCIICCKNPQPPNRVTCQGCRDRTKAAVKKSRAARKLLTSVK